MTPDALNRLSTWLHTEQRILNLDAATGHAHLRHMIEPRTHWTFMIDLERAEQRALLENLGRADYVALQPVTLLCPVTDEALTVRLVVVALYDKNKLSRERLVAAIAASPASRAERRRLAKGILKGKDIIAPFCDWGGAMAATILLDAIGEAPLPA